MSFSALGLSEKVLAAVQAAGYTIPTPIQEQAIPHVLARRDVLGIAQTGTGKTAAFTLPMITRLEHGRARARMPRTLILEPLARGVAPWWKSAARRVIALGGRADEWKLTVDVPPIVALLGNAAGLNYRELRFQSLFL